MSKSYYWNLKAIGISLITISSMSYGAKILSFILMWFIYIIGIFLFEYGCYLQYTE